MSFLGLDFDVVIALDFVNVKFDVENIVSFHRFNFDVIKSPLIVGQPP